METQKVFLARRLLTLGTLGLLLGIGYSAMKGGPVGSWLCVVSAVVAALGLHRFGRLGPDPSHLP